MERRFQLRPPPYTADRISSAPSSSSASPFLSPTFPLLPSSSNSPPPFAPLDPLSLLNNDDSSSFPSLLSSSTPSSHPLPPPVSPQSPPPPPPLPATDSAPFPAATATSEASGSVRRSRRLPLKRIENSAQRQVALCKRRNRLFRKAHEISVLCDATVGIIIFSSSGKVSEFSSTTSSMREIIQRYQGSNSHVTNSHVMLEQAIEKWKQQSIQLTNQVSYLKQRQCYIMGESDMHCSISDLEDIELTLQRSISKLRTRKLELMHQEIQELASKQNILLKENQMLREKMQEVNIVDHVSMEIPVNNGSSTADSIDTTLKLGQQ